MMVTWGLVDGYIRYITIRRQYWSLQWSVNSGKIPTFDLRNLPCIKSKQGCCLSTVVIKRCYANILKIQTLGVTAAILLMHVNSGYYSYQHASLGVVVRMTKLLFKLKIHFCLKTVSHV